MENKDMFYIRNSGSVEETNKEKARWKVDRII